MEATIACCSSARALLPAAGISTHQHSTSVVAPSFSSKGLKSSSLFGESLRQVPRSSLKFSTTKQSSHVTKCEIGDSLEEFLAKATPDKGLIRLLLSMGEALRTISFKALSYSHVCKYACSEEVPELQDMGGPVEGGFSVAFDPLDGSSIVDTNFTVGTIFGVWPGDKLTGVTGRDQVAAAMGIYGPRTTYVLAIKGFPGTHEFLLLDEGKWQHVKETTEIGEGKMFSPGNLRATFDNPDYDKLISYYVKEKYTLRYTGGMVPDVNQIIVKEKGVFTNVISPTTKAKLRLLFEVAPLGLLIENAGGYSSDGQQSVLDKVVVNLDDRTQASEARTAKWRGSVGGIVEAPIDKVWSMVSQTKRLAEWMPMVERCTDLAGEEGVPGYVRLVSGFMFPQDDGDRSWIKEKLVSMDSSQHSYAYKLEASNVGLDGSVNSLKLVDYGDESTLVDWSFEVNPVESAREDSTVDYLGFLYKSCINRIEAALEAASKKVVFKSTTNLCSSKPIVTVNGKFPGPALYAREDYTVIVKVTNHVNHSVTIHW
ncbi:hypothetical protein DVH24_022996 [Malus domestica]|uniref:Sedoheptulose-1,7-bisphosphatase, chloroplastic n=1 Tax=Malus domestica TaxID=3750 RepID=A0A498KT29_MALDO|nr:hypothetical protein DVH24_022996 [Malus domestica]